jgi:hypothetical protein
LPWPITDGKAGPFVARIDQLLSMSISWVSTLGKIYIFTYYKCIFIYIYIIYIYMYIYICMWRGPLCIEWRGLGKKSFQDL